MKNQGNSNFKPLKTSSNSLGEFQSMSVNPLKIHYDANPNSEETKQIWRGIAENAKQVSGLDAGNGFAFYLKDESQMILGGCSGYIFYGSIYVDLLWVHESLRNQHYGAQLMQHAEALGRENQCKIMTVNTMDFEARPFYEKLGFKVEFERTGFVGGDSMFFLKKDLV